MNSNISNVTNGIKMSNSEYFAHNALNASAIKLILEKPYNYFNGIHKEQSASMAFGERVHKLILESDMQTTSDNKKVVIMPNFGPQTKKENKEAKATFLKENEHNFIVSEEEFMCAKSLIDSQFGVYFSQEYKSVGFVETAYFGQIFNYDFKCKPDFFIPDLKLCIDLKTTTSVSELDFTRSCVAFKYYIQAFIYCKILNIPASNFVFLAIEKEPPYYASAYTLESFFDLAEKEIKESLYILENQHIYNKNVLIHSYDNKSNNVSYVKSIPLPAYLIQKLV